MAAASEVVKDDVRGKIEIEKSVTGLDKSDVGEVGAAVTVDGNVGGNDNVNVGGKGKSDADDSSYVLVSGGIKVNAGDPGYTGGASVDVIAAKSDSVDEVDQFKKEEFGIEYGGIPVDPWLLETNDIDHGSATVRDPDVKALKEEVNLKNGSTADPSVVLETNDIAQNLNGHLAKIRGEEEQLVKSTDEVADGNVITNVEAKTDDIVSGVTFDPELTLNPIESSQMMVFESDYTIKSADESESQLTIIQPVSTPDLINTTDELLSTPNPVRNADCEVMVTGGPESVRTVIDKAECQVTVDESGKPSEDLECQVTADGTESTEIPIKEQEYQVSVDGSEFTGNSVENQECPVSVARSVSSDSHTEVVDSTRTVIESDRKPEEHQDLLVMTSEVGVEAEPNHVCSGIKAEHLSELASAPLPYENNEAEGTVIGSGTKSEENANSGLLLPENFIAQVDGKVEKFDGIQEMRGAHISRPQADEGVPLVFNVEKDKSEEKFEKQVEGNSGTLDKVTESVELKANFEEMKEEVKTENEIPESQIVVLENVQDDLILEDNTAESANEAEAQLSTETNIQPITHDYTASRRVVSSCVDGTQEGFRPEGSAEDVEILPSADSVISECKNGELLVEKDNHSLSNTDDLSVVEPDVEIIAQPLTENRSAEGMDRGTGIKIVHVSDDEEKETEVTEAPFGDYSTLCLPDTYVSPGSVIEFDSFRLHETVPNIHDDVIVVPEVVNEETEPACGANSDNPERNVDGSHGDGNSTKISCTEVEDMDGIQSDEMAPSSVEGSLSDAPDLQNEEADVQPYNFLIRIPRFEDETIREQIRRVQSELAEKTRLRDAIRVEIHGKRARLRALNEEFYAMKLEDTAARREVRFKREEIDTVQSIINRMKNAISVEGIDSRIYDIEYMIQHETLILKDENQFIREIKQMKILRDQLASNIGSREEVQKAFEQKDAIEESMKVLRKELASLKANVSKSEAALIALGKKYEEESKKERKLHSQFTAANEVRQKAYADLHSLKKQAYEKNKDFLLYKQDVTAARDFASRGDTDGLHHLCTNQVEAFMEQWNNNAEFRNEYVSRCNMNANRKQRTSDGGSPVPDDVAPALPSNVNDEADSCPVSVQTEVKSVSVVPAVKQQKMVSSADNNSIENVSGQNNQTLKTEDLVKPTLGSEIVVVEEKDEAIDSIKVKEEMELARKAEESRREEIAAKLKEQRRLEEKAKAAEALERKKRNAEKAQLRAELRARKEAEQKEKEREKRLRKKEKKKVGGDGSVIGDDAASSESSNEATTKETEAFKELPKKKSQKPPAHFFSKQLKPKPIPPPVINRNKKWWQQWGKLVMIAVVILALFLLGNTGFFLNLKVSKAANGGV